MQEGLEKLLKSKKYRGISEDAIKRVFDEAARRQPSAKLADKAARAKLHQIAGAFITPEGIEKARNCLRDYLAGDEAALYRAMSLHSSTRERPDAVKLYERVIALIGKPGMTLDLACGLNPLVLGRLGLKAWACDISLGAVGVVNEWAKACSWDIEAVPGDLLQIELPKGDLALMMKLLPLIERQGRGEAAKLFNRVRARCKFVTFPTKTLTGRDVGMESHYADWFEPIFAERARVIEKFVQDDELCYLLEEKYV